MADPNIEPEQIKEFTDGYEPHREHLNQIVRKVNKLSTEGVRKYAPTYFTGCSNGVPVVWEIPALLVRIPSLEVE